MCAVPCALYFCLCYLFSLLFFFQKRAERINSRDKKNITWNKKKAEKQKNWCETAKLGYAGLLRQQSTAWRTVFVGPLGKLSTHTHQHTKRPSVAHNSVSRIQSDRKLYFLIACSKLKTIKNYSQLLSVCYRYVMCSYFCLCYLFSLLFFFQKRAERINSRETKKKWDEQQRSLLSLGVRPSFDKVLRAGGFCGSPRQIIYTYTSAY